jgi:hypothetical protein
MGEESILPIYTEKKLKTALGVVHQTIIPSDKDTFLSCGLFLSSWTYE